MAIHLGRRAGLVASTLLVVAGASSCAAPEELAPPSSTVAITQPGSVASSAAAQPGSSAVGVPPSASSGSPGAGGPAAAAGSVSAPPAQLEVEGNIAPVFLAPVADDGSLLVPEDVAELGWWIGSAPMGAAGGTTLIAGHVDSAEQGLGVFADLRTVEVGDQVAVVDGLGGRHAFEVSEIDEVVKSALPEELFTTSGPRRLALVTCGGPFDTETRSYRDNLIVWAEPVIAG